MFKTLINNLVIQFQICSKTFSRKDNMKKHLLTHSEKHKCDICSKEFSRKDSFNKHLATHSGIKPFSCEVCRTKFTCRMLRRLCHFTENSSLSLALHSQLELLLISQTFTNIPKFRIRGLRIVLRSKTVHPLQICSKSFRRRDHMNKHFRTHSKGKSLSESVRDYQLQLNNDMDEQDNETDPLALYECEARI